MAIGTIEQARQAREELASKNHKIIYQLPEELRIAGDPIHIFNVSNKTFHRSMGGFGPFVIPACEKGQPYSRPLQIPFIMSEGIPVDMEHIEFRETSGRAFAQDVVGFGKFRHPTEDLREQGVFIAAGSVPTESELSAARAKYRERLMELVTAADSHYGGGPGEWKNIGAEHREALDALLNAGMEFEERLWHKQLKASSKCPACQESIPVGSVRCNRPGCGAIIDWEKAYSFGLVSSPTRPGTEPKETAKAAKGK
jgi:hypothetical protein